MNRPSDKQVTCLFLGSGASLALAGIPIQRDFLCSVLTEERAQWIDECGIPDSDRLEIAGSPLSAWMLDVGDIELCMSHLHSVAYPNPKSNKGLSPDKNNAINSTRRAIVNMRAAIADYLKDKHIKLDEKIHIDFCKFIKELRRKYRLVILTTNYDLVLEKLLSNNNLPYYYPTVTNNNNNNGIPIYKLHGSINWLEKRWFNGKQLKSNKDIRRKRKADFLPVPDDMSQLKVMEKNRWTYLFIGDKYKRKGKNYNTYNPILIPFFYQKGDWLGGGWKNIFPKHWESAAEEFFKNSLKHIYFLGYSLPPADHHMLSWLLNILKKNKPRITIVCNDHNKPLERVLRPFQPRVCRCGLERFLEDHLCLS